MRAAILAIGSELLGTERLDTNSLLVTACFEPLGIALVRKAVVGDDERAIAHAVTALCDGVDVVVVTGGLGPTTDDCTRAGVARACGLPLEESSEVVNSLERRYAARGRPMAAVNRRQAQVICGAEILANGRGSAPGQRLEHDATTLFLLPGPPHEMDGMLDAHVVPWLAAEVVRRGEGGTARPRRVFSTTGLPESVVEERLLPLYERFGAASIAVLARPGQVSVVASPAEALALEAITTALRASLGTAIFAEYGPDDGAEPADRSLVAVVGRLLKRSAKTVTTAESCTGGLLGGRLTAVSGSSAFFPGGVVTYSNELKAQLLGVSNDLMVAHGAVSAPVAEAMAQGVRQRLGSDFGLGITGIAGPGGGSDEKPVGTVFLALAGDDVDPRGVHVERAFLAGDRELVREQSVCRALDLLRLHLQASTPAHAADRLASWEG